MKTAFIAVNSKYVHTSLSVRYLRGYAVKSGLPCDTVMREYTVNMQRADVLSSLYSLKADIYCFSVYIFNRVFLLSILPSLKRLLPDAVFICGGPEASADDEGLLSTCPAVDFISLGEGEYVLTELLFRLCCASAAEVKEQYVSAGGSGVSFVRSGDFYRYINNKPVCDLDKVPFPYTGEELSVLRDRIVYYETSRGCPFFCTYCCSGRSGGVRTFSDERIFTDISRLMKAGLRQVKLVDRTFNYDRKRTVRIMKYIIENHNGITNFHLEIAPWLINEDFLALLEKAPRNVFRFEAGIQTTNPCTLRAINRHVELAVYRPGLQRLIDMGFTVHLDLIAGLPYEDYDSFGHSFDEVISLRPEELQLGFLKVLKGTAVASDTEHGIVSEELPPYEILYNKYISYNDLERLRRIEKLTDRLFNGSLARTLTDTAADLLFGGSRFAFYEALSEYFVENAPAEGELTSSSIYSYLYSFLSSYTKVTDEVFITVLDSLLFDFFSYGKTVSLPDWVTENCIVDRRRLSDCLRDPGSLIRCMDSVQSGIFTSVEPKKWFRNSELVKFNNGNTILFLYGSCLDKGETAIWL